MAAVFPGFAKPHPGLYKRHPFGVGFQDTSRMRFPLIGVLLLYVVAPASAALDPETKVPYQLRVVLRVADHPNFTDYYRRDLQRELHGQLQAALGALGAVEVIDMLNIKK